MSIQGNKLVEPIGLQEVYSLLGVAKTGTYYDVATICGNGHGKINMWARNKPMRVDTPVEITEVQKHAAAYGLNAVFSNSQNPVWEYLPPRAGNDWSRLTDFVGYDHRSTCGLAFKSYEYTKNLFVDKTGLQVELEDSADLITAYDLRDTLFSGMSLRLLMSNREGSGQSYAANSAIDRQSIVFTIPYDQLLLRGAGSYNLSLYGVSASQELLRIFPTEYERGLLTLTNDTGISVYNWKDNMPTTQVKHDDGSVSYLYEYTIGQYNNTLDLTDKHFIFSNITFDSNLNDFTLSNASIYMVFEWDEPEGRAVKRVPMMLNGYQTWYNDHDGFSIDNLGCGDVSMPLLTTPEEPNRYTTIFMAYKHTDGEYYSITPKITIRIKRDNGTEPDFINPN